MVPKIMGSIPGVSSTVIHLFQPDSLELRGHLVMFQSMTLQGQAGLSQELSRSVAHKTVEEVLSLVHTDIEQWNVCSACFLLQLGGL